MDYPIRVHTSKYTKRSSIRKLERWGFHYTGQYEYSGILPENKIKRFSSFCHKSKLNYKINTSFGERSNSYRAKFFQTYHPYVGDLYFCAYCGRLIRKKNLTVDHLYPVGRVSISGALQKRLRRMGINSVNDVKNLVPSCQRCNQKKAAKMGLWIIRGKVGRNQYVWVLRHAVRLAVLIVLLYNFLIQKNNIDIIWYYGLIAFNTISSWIHTISVYLL